MAKAGFILVSLILASLSLYAYGLQSEELALILKGYKQKRSQMGHKLLTKESEEEVHTYVNFGKKYNVEQPEDLTSIHETIFSTKKEKVKEAISQCTANANHTGADYFEFLARSIGTVSPSNPTLSFKGRCFETIDVSYKQIAADSVELTFHTQKRNKNPFCLDYYVVGSLVDVHIELLYMTGRHRLTLKEISPDHLNVIQTHGIHVFGFCDQLIHILPDILKTAMLFVGGLGLNPRIPFFGSKPPKWMERANVRFVKQATGYQWRERKDVKVFLDESEIGDGDFLAITRFDGLDQFIEYFSGTHSGHSTVALRVDGELYVVESQNAWYWPTKNIQRTPWKQWLQWADNAGFNVAVLPMKPEARSRFNTTAAVEWFKKVEGMPYGYHTFIFSALDTKTDNFPPLYDSDFLLALINILGNVLPPAFDSMFGEGMNFRLGTKGLDFKGLYAEILRRNQTFQDIWAIPELDGTWYSDGYSYVCSSFVAGIYKAGGLFGNMTIQATEFTPRDVYLLNIFDQHPKRPEACQKADPDLPYCQLMGNWKMDLPEFGTLEPYPHMSESCATLPPDYFRKPGC